MKVENLINSTGNRVKNQFVITHFDGDQNVDCITFQSYDSEVCRILPEKKKIILGRDYDFSQTTKKHLYNFFRQYPITENLADKKTLNDAIKNYGYTWQGEKITLVYDEKMY